MPKNIIIIAVLLVIIFTTFFTLKINSGLSRPPSKTEIETAINQANHLYRQEKDKGRDFSTGPCLSDALLPDWVVDIVHDPRLPIDDLPANQCPSYREGRALHFVEFDTEGKLIRTK